MDAPSIRVLHCSESAEFARATRRSLESVGIDVGTVQAREDALDRLEFETYDCVVSGYWLDQGTGLDLLDDVRTRSLDLPFLLYTSESRREIATEALEAGATDYVWKDSHDVQFDLLTNRIRNAVARHRAETGRSGAESEIAQTLEQTRENLTMYRTLVETAGDAMYALDEDGYIQMVNEAHVEFSGATRKELLGAHSTEFMRAEEVEKGTELILDILKSDDRRRGRFDFEVEVDGETRIFEDNLAVLYDEQGEYDGSVGVVRDVTERRRQERQLERQNERLDEFASVVSHDLQNPLNIVSGYVEPARETGDDEYFDAIVEAADRMNELLDDLLTLAREGRSVRDRTAVEVGTVALEAWGVVSVVESDLTVDADGVTVMADESRLRELLENLFRNAVEHGSKSPRNESGDTVEKGSTSPRNESGDAAENGSNGVSVTVEATDSGFAVVDDGPGIPPEERETVFERGYTGGSGTGLGLSIVETIAEAHGWSVSVTDAETGGARFEVETR